MCRSFYEVQIIAPPSAWQQLAKMGEGIKLTLGMTRKSLMADGKNHRQVPRAERGRAFRMPSADPERPRGAGSNFDRAGEQAYKITADLPTRAATLRERRPMEHYICSVTGPHSDTLVRRAEL